eukprot:1612937-Amphidinium_carterae.1
MQSLLSLVSLGLTLSDSTQCIIAGRVNPKVMSEIRAIIRIGIKMAIGVTMMRNQKGQIRIRWSKKSKVSQGTSM